MDTGEFLTHVFAFAPPGSLVESAYGAPPTRRSYCTVEDLPSLQLENDVDQYYGPATRKERGGEKESVAGTSSLWVDLDAENFGGATLLPSADVWSGHGHHLYWFLKEWCNDVERIEAANKALAGDTEPTGDACWNANRLLRTPGTRNLRGQSPALCEVRRVFPDRTYRLEDILPLAGLDAKTRHKIRTGDKRGYRSRSERDWAVVCRLVDAGADDELIRHIFNTRPVGEKFREEGGGVYLERTLERVRAREERSSRREIEERDDGYYIPGRKGDRRISTFVIHPRLLLADTDARATSEDAILGSVVASGYTWHDATFSRSAFTSVGKLDRETRLMAWQWLGKDEDVRLLLPHLMEILKDQGLPKVSATRVLGLHRQRMDRGDLGAAEDRWYFAGDRTTLSAEEAWPASRSPLVYMESGREHPSLNLDAIGVPRGVLDTLPSINSPEVFWPCVGWYAAAPLKPVFESLGYRFPILNVHGTKGSGKTTTILRVMMPLFGQTEPKAYDANTTRFVVLSVLGSSNAVPVAFSEFRFGSAGEFLRYVLLAYDTGHDPRGRADQTTVDYPLSAPFSVDGEDLIADPAARERIIPVTMHPAAIAEDSDAFKAFKEVQRVNLATTGFGRHYIQSVLGALVDGSFERTLAESRRDIMAAFPRRLPDRVRNNFIVVRVGVRLFCTAAGLSIPDARTFQPCVRICYDSELGRAPTYADELVEDVVNACASPGRHAGVFASHYDAPTGVLWFQLAPAHSWWLYQRRKQNRGALEKDAIRNQLGELEYVSGPSNVDGIWMYGVDLKAAKAIGLDVPDNLNLITVSF